MTLCNVTAIKQHQSKKAYDHDCNGLVYVDLVASNDLESEVQVDSPTTTNYKNWSSYSGCCYKEPDVNNWVKKHLFERFADSITTPTSKLKYKKTLKVISNKTDSNHNLAMEYIHTAPEKMSSGAWADHLMEYLD